jgi:hypothetical protein
MASTSKNIESIVKQWTSIDLKSIRVKCSLPIYTFDFFFVCWHNTSNYIISTFLFFASLFVKCFSIYLFELDFLINEWTDQTVE